MTDDQVWAMLKRTATKAYSNWSDDPYHLEKGFSALADLGALEKEVRTQVVRFLVRLAQSKNKLDPKTLAFLAEAGVSGAGRNRLFDALIDSSDDD